MVADGAIYQSSGRRLNICMVSDFFYPNMGGVESHIYCLSQRLLKRGHKVVVVTHSYRNRTGIRYVVGGLKVYYIPLYVFYNQVILPTLVYGCFPILRQIFLRERINVVHSHQAFSYLGHEALFHARTLGLKTIFTDHSLFGFADASSILTNKILKFTLSDVDHVICVSNTSKENTVLRAALSPTAVSVIPNAVVAAQFRPDPSKRDPNYSNIYMYPVVTIIYLVTIVVVSRLVYRKGMDLLVAIIPRICSQFPKVRFIIAGDGPKRIDLEQMRENFMLHDRVEFLGSVKHSEVRNVLVRGNIFLNTSLTEAFCVALVEAACCGLLVVSTKVGGVPEVLPSNMTLLARPEDDHLVETLYRAIRLISTNEISTSKFHDEVAKMYSWDNVAERTEVVYALKSNYSLPLIARLRKYYGCGAVAGKIACILVIIDYLILCFLELLHPRKHIDVAPDLTPEIIGQCMSQIKDKGRDNHRTQGGPDSQDAVSLRHSSNNNP